MQLLLPCSVCKYVVGGASERRSGNGVISATSPWVTSENAPYRQCESFQWAMFHECLSGIFGARRRETA